ncbi:hypothetical protein [Sporosarcina limicola]|uniref:Uncharacterized protein n=1 Tax=Sporosarcina limicola TaxID=34101 RepID=A0A927MJ01_9BACL|nr:hypothetical protein [Sporosarcina limicola]MBE1555280.1 hypothetical protein [Sporosarcina limicola]
MGAFLWVWRGVTVLGFAITVLRIAMTVRTSHYSFTDCHDSSHEPLQFYGLP